MASAAAHHACSRASQTSRARPIAASRRPQVAAAAAARGSGASGPAAAAPPSRAAKHRGLLDALVQQARREVVDGWLSDLVAPLLTDDPGAAEPPPVTRSPQELADPDSRFVDVDGVNLHYKECRPEAAVAATGPAASSTATESSAAAGGGAAVQQAAQLPAIVLVHGFNGSTFNWRSMMQPLADATGCRCVECMVDLLRFDLLAVALPMPADLPPVTALQPFYASRVVVIASFLCRYCTAE